MGARFSKSWPGARKSRVVTYTDGFKARMVERMAGPTRISATRLSREAGVPQSTLSRWLKNARSLGSMNGEQNDDRERPKSTRQWSAEQKLEVVLKAASLSEEELGPFLRREGLHSAQIDEWREQAISALGAAAKKSRRRGPSAEAKRVKELERELLRKDRALAEVTALLALKKKLEAIWGDEDDGTPPRTGT